MRRLIKSFSLLGIWGTVCIIDVSDYCDIVKTVDAGMILDSIDDNVNSEAREWLKKVMNLDKECIKQDSQYRCALGDAINFKTFQSHGNSDLLESKCHHSRKEKPLTKNRTF